MNHTHEPERWAPYEGYEGVAATLAELATLTFTFVFPIVSMGGYALYRRRWPLFRRLKRA